MIRAPHLAPGVWLNSEQSWTLEELITGHILLVDFWDYTCINCIRTLPYLTAWHERYATLGLRIVGIHTPEFAFAKEATNVERAIKRFDLPYPVLLDNDLKNWHGFTVKAWPTKIIVDGDRRIRYSTQGEGRYNDTEATIQALLRDLHGSDLDLPPLLEPLRPTDTPGAVCYRTTPEFHLGGDVTPLQNISHPGNLESALHLRGIWHPHPDYQLAGVEALAVLRYHATEVNAVLASDDGTPRRLFIFQDDAPLTVDDAGADIVMDSELGSYVTVSTPRLYNLVSNPLHDEHTLTFVPNEGVQVYSLTFGTCIS